MNPGACGGVRALGCGRLWHGVALRVEWWLLGLGICLIGFIRLMYRCCRQFRAMCLVFHVLGGFGMDCARCNGLFVKGGC